jgi:hypothetical protein
MMTVFKEAKSLSIVERWIPGLGWINRSIAEIPYQISFVDLFVSIEIPPDPYFDVVFCESG